MWPVHSWERRQGVGSKRWLLSLGQAASVRSGQLWDDGQLQVHPFTKGILVTGHSCSQVPELQFPFSLYLGGACWVKCYPAWCLKQNRLEDNSFKWESNLLLFYHCLFLFFFFFNLLDLKGTYILIPSHKMNKSVTGLLTRFHSAFSGYCRRPRLLLLLGQWSRREAGYECGPWSPADSSPIWALLHSGLLP